MTRPLISLDLETTGADPATARIVEIALVRVPALGLPPSWCHAWRVNPGCPIPAEATAVHGITDADVVDAPAFETIATAVAAELIGADLVGYNLRAFDLPLLRDELQRAGVAWPCGEAAVIDAFLIYRERERHTLESAVRFYAGREHVGAHGALADAQATLDVLAGQLRRYPDLPPAAAELAAHAGGRRPEWATDCGRLRWSANGELVLAFSKHSGKRLADVDRGFCAWMLKGDFAPDVKELVRLRLRGETPKRPG